MFPSIVNMVLGRGNRSSSDGGRTLNTATTSASSTTAAAASLSYGAVDESDAIILAVPSGSSGSSGAEEDSDDGCSGSGRSSMCGSTTTEVLLHENCYQRQPLLPLYASTSTSDQEPSTSYFSKVTGKKNGHHDGAHHSATASNGKTSFFNATATSAVNAVNGLVKIQMPSPHRDEPRFPPEKFKTFVAFLFTLIAALINTTTLGIVHERVPEKSDPLPDIFLDNVPVQDWGLKVSEIMIICMNYFTVIAIVFHKHRHIVFRRLFLLMGFLYLYRSVTIFVTVLPVANPNYYCSPKSNHTTPFMMLERGLSILSGFGMYINGKHTYCGDYIFSGHTMVLVLCYLVMAEYTSKRWWILHWLYAILGTVGVLMVLIARGHYTLDCILAYYITTRLWYIYHTMANNPSLKEAGPHNYFSRIWWFPVFRYFEGNVGGTVPRQYEWPLPWPRRWGAKLPQRTS